MLFDLAMPAAGLNHAIRTAVDQSHRAGKQIAHYRFGFYRLTFGDSRRDDGFVLNVWLPDIAKEELPHTHIFSLKSRILLGSITDVIWSVEDDPGGKFRIVEPVCSETMCEDKISQERVRLTEKERRVFKENQVYLIPKGGWHSSHANDQLAVTLMQKIDVDPLAQPKHLVPEDKADLTRSFDFYDHNQQEAWEIIFDAVRRLPQ